jgi:O-antigen biosynthesis alpha-1,2-mannosyltransferase
MPNVRWLPNQVTIFAAANDQRIGLDDGRVVRAWMKDRPSPCLNDLAAAVDRSGVDVLVIQLNFNFFDFVALERLILGQKQKNRTVLVTLHSTQDPPGNPEKKLSLLSHALQSCDRVIVHSYHDLNRLKSIDVVHNVTLLSHGLLDGAPLSFHTSGQTSTFTIGSYGFCLPHKGLRRLLAAFAILAKSDPSLRLHLINSEYPNDVSRRLVNEIRGEIEHLECGDRVSFTSKFLPDEHAMKRLTECDLIVFPYEESGESASGAVRFGIASGRPVLTSSLPIFEDIESAVFRLQSTAPPTMAIALKEMITQLRNRAPNIAHKATSSEKWRRDHSYEALAARLSGLLEALHMNSLDAAVGQAAGEVPRGA